MTEADYQSLKPGMYIKWLGGLNKQYMERYRIVTTPRVGIRNVRSRVVDPGLSELEVGTSQSWSKEALLEDNWTIDWTYQLKTEFAKDLEEIINE